MFIVLIKEEVAGMSHAPRTRARVGKIECASSLQLTALLLEVVQDLTCFRDTCVEIPCLLLTR